MLFFVTHRYCATSHKFKYLIYNSVGFIFKFNPKNKVSDLDPNRWLWAMPLMANLKVKWVGSWVWNDWTLAAVQLSPASIIIQWRELITSPALGFVYIWGRSIKWLLQSYSNTIQCVYPMIIWDATFCRYICIFFREYLIKVDKCVEWST